MVKGAYNETFSAFYFNLHADVGQGCANRLDDVELVRYGIACLAAAPVNRADPNLRPFLEAAARVKATGPFDSFVSNAVLAFQKTFDTMHADGKVSVIRGDRSPHGHIYVLQTMTAAMRLACTRVYPRLDLVPETGPALSQVVRKMFLGSL